MGLNNEFATTYRPWLCFDIETAPLPDCEEFLTDPIEAPSNWKDPLKIAAYVKDKRQQQIADAGLDLDLCEVVAIAGRFHDEAWVQTSKDYSEEFMLESFWRFVRTLQRDNGVIVGFNCLGFDLPILLRRSMYLRVPVPSLQIDKYRHDGVIDVQHELTFGGRMTWRSLAFYCKRFRVEYDDSISGEQIAELVSKGQWNQVEKHVVSDVKATAELAQRLGLIRVPSQVAVA